VFLLTRPARYDLRRPCSQRRAKEQRLDASAFYVSLIKCKTCINHHPMNKETPIKIHVLTENHLTEAMRLIKPADWNHTKKHLLLENFLVYWAKEFQIHRAGSGLQNKTPNISKGEIIMSTNTIRLHRVVRATPERVYRAFLDADAMAKWLPPNGFTGKVHHIDAKIGGTYKMSFTNFTTGHSHSFGGQYLELVPNERIRHTDKFDDPNLPGEMQTTVSLKQVSCGTELNIIQEGIPEAIPPEACYLGWQESLTLLAQLVEAEIRE